MKWINAENMVTVKLFDEEHEEYINKTMSVEDMLDAYTEEGCPSIYSQPTIEPPIKHGRWIEDAETFYKAVNEKGGGVDADTPYFTEDNIVCSECLAFFNVIDNCTELFNYCPNCGAKMDGGENGIN